MNMDASSEASFEWHLEYYAVQRSQNHNCEIETLRQLRVTGLSCADFAQSSALNWGLWSWLWEKPGYALKMSFREKTVHSQRPLSAANGLKSLAFCRAKKQNCHTWRHISFDMHASEVFSTSLTPQMHFYTIRWQAPLSRESPWRRSHKGLAGAIMPSALYILKRHTSDMILRPQTTMQNCNSTFLCQEAIRKAGESLKLWGDTKLAALVYFRDLNCTALAFQHIGLPSFGWMLNLGLLSSVKQNNKSVRMTFFLACVK